MSLKSLEIKKLMKELDFYEADYEYKNELVNQSEIEFIKSVNEYLNEYPELKELFEDKINKRMSDFINQKVNYLNNLNSNDSNISDIDFVNNSMNVSVNINMKKLYREIAKKTHPDKVNDSDLNDAYVRATKSYENNDILSIYKICDDLKIHYDIDLEDSSLFKDKINSLKDKIDFIQSTYTWKWSIIENEIEKKKILLDYIKTQLSS